MPYGGDAMETITAIYERDGDWWVASVPDLLGANTQGRTLDEARENLKDAVRVIRAASRELSRRRKDAP
jgi:predicted RNase H-like HicB family nuclease